MYNFIYVDIENDIDYCFRVTENCTLFTLQSSEESQEKDQIRKKGEFKFRM